MSRRKFTTSRDGVLRADVVVRVRLTAEEIEKLEACAKRSNKKLADMLSVRAGLAIQDLIDENHERTNQTSSVKTG